MTAPRGRAWLTASGPDPELLGMIAVSVAVHVAVALLLYVLPRELLSSTPPPVVAYTVKIVDPNALGGRLPPGKVRPDRKPEAAADAARGKPEPEKPKAKPAPPKPEPKPEAKKPPPKAEKKPEPKPAEKAVKVPDKKVAKPPAKPREPSAAEKARLEQEERNRRIQEAVRRVGERGGAPEASGLGGTEQGPGKALGTGGDGGGGGILTGLDFIIYKNQVESIIKQNWTWVGSNPNLTVRVGFRIQEDGQIRDVRIVQASGDSGYDQSVLRAVKGSSLPPPPEKYRDVFADYLLDFESGDLQS